VVGLVASRLKEKFLAAGVCHRAGAGRHRHRLGPLDRRRRSRKAVRQAVKDGVVDEGGGHAMAAGVTLRKERLAEFRAYMETTLAADVAASRHANEIFIDGAVSARAVTTELAATLNRAGPFGSGNPEPVIALPFASTGLCRSFWRRAKRDAVDNRAVDGFEPDPQVRLTQLRRIDQLMRRQRDHGLGITGSNGPARLSVAASSVVTRAR